MVANRDQIARALNVSPRRVNQLVLEGMPRLSTGAYNTGACLVWYSRYLLRALAREASPADLAEVQELYSQKLRLLRAQAEAADFELQRESSQVVPRELYRATMIDRVTRLRQHILAMLDRTALNADERDRWGKALRAVIAGLESGLDVSQDAAPKSFAGSPVKGSTKKNTEEKRNVKHSQ